MSLLFYLQAKNTDHREQLKNAPTTGLQLAGYTEKQKLPEQFVQEALILSDILELNEFVCVELLLAGEQQQPNFPGLTRGLVAVLLYHDGRRCLISALRTLIQSREGITWTLGLYEEMTQLVTKFTDELLEEGNDVYSELALAKFVVITGNACKSIHLQVGLGLSLLRGSLEY